jgi:hypothetical protein
MGAAVAETATAEFGAKPRNDPGTGTQPSRPLV